MPYPEWAALRRLLMANAAKSETLTYTEKTASGNPATFTTNISKDLTGLTIPFTPVQEGSGDPSPDNVRPISGYDGVTITANGADVVVDFGETGTVYGGTLDAVTGVLTVEYGCIDLGALTWTYQSAQLRFFGSRIPNCIHAPSTTSLSNIYCSAYRSDIGDNTKADGPDKIIALSASVPQPLIRDLNYDTVESFAAAVSGVKLVYELVTPETIQLDPATVRAIAGANSISTNTNGTNTVKYLSWD